MRIFVAGATGVIGRRVVPELVARGHAVTAMARDAVKADRLIDAGATPVEASLFEPAALASAVAGHDVVINLATHVPSSRRMFLPGAWRENDRVRREGAANLVDAALAGGAKRYIQESFAPIYPSRGAQWIDETAPLMPSRYNRSVIDAERSAERFAMAGGVGLCLRFGLFYGPGTEQWRDLVNFVRMGWAPMPGRPEAYVSSVSHDDAAAAVIAALNADSGAYNVVDDEPVTHRDYFNALAALLLVPPPKLPPAWATFLSGSPGEMLARSLRISNAKLKGATGWSPRHPSVREGFRAILEAMEQSP